MSTEIYNLVNEVLDGKEIMDRHSFFQLRYFLVGKEPTHQMRLWRCIRELNARRQTLDSLNLELEDAKDKAELMEINIERLKTPGDFGVERGVDALDKRELDIRLRRLIRKKQALEASFANIHKKIREVEEECAFLVTAYKNLEEQEALKPYDDFESQLKYWDAKISQDIQIRMLTGLPLDPELIKTSLSLDDRSAIKQLTLKMMNKNKISIAAQQHFKALDK